MVRGRSLIAWGAISVLVFFLIGAFGFSGAESLSTGSGKGKPDRARADVITVASLAVFGDLQRPPVVFLHDAHTDALKKKNKDCMTCHLSEADRLSPKFKRLKDSGRQEVMDIYHINCIECHKQTAAAKEKSGPVVCGECHRKKSTILSSRSPIGFDKSLHYRHSRAQKHKCERCHHEYDQKRKKLFYAKNREGTCRYCHMKQTQVLVSEKRVSIGLASHVACIGCHRKTRAKSMFAGPVSCSGCHDANQQKTIEKLDNVPRMKRNQPDFVLIRAGGKQGLAPRMHRVPFSHAAHEGHNDTCRVCHHKELKSCLDCHTLAGSKEAKDVKLLQAMHKFGTKRSCLGCHEIKQRSQRCAGCHKFILKGRKTEASFCVKCHMAPFRERTGVLTETGERDMARMLSEIWWAIFGTQHSVDVPEKVIIKELEHSYEPVEFPHRRIFRALEKKINGDKLANYFHLEERTLCQGCHHYTPAARRPPRCGFCHGKPFEQKNLLEPGLKAAFHRQCMGCHDTMGIKKPVSVDCTGCHMKRES